MKRHSVGDYSTRGMVYRAIPQKLNDIKTQVNDSTTAFCARNSINSAYEVYEAINLETESELTSSSEFEFLCSTEASEAELSEREKRKRINPDLMAPIPGPDSQLQEVKGLCGPEASVLPRLMICL